MQIFGLLDSWVHKYVLSTLMSELSLAGVLGVLHPRNLGALLTLFQPEGADYAHHITGSTPGFGNLTTALDVVVVVEVEKNSLLLRLSLAIDTLIL